MNTLTLVDKEGDLYFPDTVVPYPDMPIDNHNAPGPIVLCVYKEGDCDTIEWPNVNIKNLARALYDAREMGYFDDDTVILLPNGGRVNY